MKTNIMVCGLLWSGSSAVRDFLSEYDNVGVIHGEFDEFRREGMIGDHIEGYISEIYPSRIEATVAAHRKELPPRGFKGFIKRFLLHTPLRHTVKLDQTMPWRYTLLLRAYRRMLESDSREETLSVGREWIRDLGEHHAKDKDYVLFDQPILLGQHEDIWPDLFRPFKLIAVYRDPRDQLAEIIRQGQLFFHFRSPETAIYGGGRSGAVRYVLHTLNCRLQHLAALLEIVPANSIKLICFEQFVQHHADMKAQLGAFLGIDEAEHKGALKAFDPARSRQNIGIHSSILLQEEYEPLTPFMAWYGANSQKTSLQ